MPEISTETRARGLMDVAGAACTAFWQQEKEATFSDMKFVPIRYQ